MTNKIIQYGKYVGLSLVFSFILGKIPLYSNTIFKIIENIERFGINVVGGGVFGYCIAMILGLFLPLYLSISIFDKNWKLDKDKFKKIAIALVIVTVTTLIILKLMFSGQHCYEGFLFCE